MAILSRPGPKLAEQERILAKRFARELLDGRKAERLSQVPQVALQAAARRHIHNSYCVREEVCMR